MDSWMIIILPLLIGWLFDLLLGDPAWLPHPVVGFGKMISWGEHRLNQGLHRMLKGALLAIGLILLVFFVAWYLRYLFICCCLQVIGLSLSLMLSSSSIAWQERP